MSDFRFGIYPENVKVNKWWGARGIFKPYDKYCKLDIPYDRQNYEGEKDKDFLFWINNEFKDKLEKQYSELDDGKTITITSDAKKLIIKYIVLYGLRTDFKNLINLILMIKLQLNYNF